MDRRHERMAKTSTREKKKEIGTSAKKTNRRKHR
jgi:hypothetical protein